MLNYNLCFIPLECFNSEHILFFRKKIFFVASREKKLILTTHNQSLDQNIKRKTYFPSVHVKFFFF